MLHSGLQLPSSLRRRRLGLIAVSLLCAACSGEDATRILAGDAPQSDAPVDDEPVAPEAPPAAPQLPDVAAYALTSAIFDTTTAATYLTLLERIEPRADIELASAREFAGWVDASAFAGSLFVASGEAPQLERFAARLSAPLEADGTLSFANYTSATLSMSGNLFLRADTALMAVDETTRVLWNPSSLSIVGSASELPIESSRDGLIVTTTVQPSAVRGSDILQSYYWHDADWYAFHPTSQIAVLDALDGQLEQLLDAPCPALHLASQDEAGNLYFSPLRDIIAYQLLDAAAPSSCVVRVDAGQTRVAEGWPRDLSELTGGRPTGELTYLKDGRALLTVYHDERVSIGSDTTPASLITAQNWRLWLVDLEAWQARPIDELGWLGAGINLSTMDGRAFLFTSSPDFSSTTIHEVLPDGHTERLFAVPGFADGFVKLR